MKVTFALFCTGILLAPVGSNSAFAVTAGDAKAEIARVCVRLDPACIELACGSISASRDWSESDQATLGRLIAQVIDTQADTNPSGGDAIQACVVDASATLVSSFQTARNEDIADIGQPIPASDQ